MTEVDRHDTGSKDLDYTMSLLDGYRASLTLFAACELELFDLVAKGENGSRTAEDIVAEKGWDLGSLERLMNSLVALKMLHKRTESHGDTYSCTPSGGYLRRHAEETVWSYTPMAKRMFSSILDMPEEIKSGRHQKSAFPAHVTVHKAASNNPIDFVEEEEHHKRHDHSGNHHRGHDNHGSHDNHGHRGNHGHHRHHHQVPREPSLNATKELEEIEEEEAHHSNQYHGQPPHPTGHHHGHHKHHTAHGGGLIDNNALRERYHAFDTVGKLQASHLMTAYDLSHFNSAVDLGAGTGCMGFEMARVYKNMKVTLMDVPRVTELVKHHFMPNDIDKLRIDFLPGDFFITELPEADLYLMSKIVHDWNDEQVKKLLHLCYDKITPGGGILLFEKCLNDHKDGPVSAHMWDVFIMTLCAGRLRSGKEYRQLLESVGFSEVQIHRTQEQCTFDIIYARKH